MRINELVHVLAGGLLLLATSLECGKSDHVHLKIHMPDIIHKHKHVKTKFVHIFHPKAVHTDHSSIQFLHSRKDPNHGFPHGGYGHPPVNSHRKPELRITEAEFQKWRHEQFQKALEERNRVHENQNEPDEDNDNDNEDEISHDESRNEEEEEEEDELYKKHKANKANSSSSRKESSKHGNHNYNQDYEASNSDKIYANYPSRTRKTNKKRLPKPSPAVHQMVERPRKKQKPYGFIKQHEAEASNVSPQIYAMSPIVVDPTYYSTLPKDQTAAGSDNQDDIYSGLMSARYTKKTADQSKLLGDINYNRKKQTKAVASLNRKTQ